MRETFPHSPSSFPHPVYVIPAKAGICAPVRDNGVPSPFPIAARSKSRRQTRRRRKSTQYNRVRQTTTETRARTRARRSRHGVWRWVVQKTARARRPSSSFPHPVYVIPAPTHVIRALPHVIPAKAGICVPARGNGVPLPFPIAARSKS